MSSRHIIIAVMQTATTRASIRVAVQMVYKYVLIIFRASIQALKHTALWKMRAAL